MNPPPFGAGRPSPRQLPLHIVARLAAAAARPTVPHCRPLAEMASPISHVPLPTARTPRRPRPPRPPYPSTVHTPPGRTASPAVGLPTTAPRRRAHRAPLRPSSAAKLSATSAVHMPSPDPAGRATSKPGYESAWAARESPTRPTVTTHHCRPIAARATPPSTRLHSPTDVRSSSQGAPPTSGQRRRHYTAQRRLPSGGPLSLQTPPSPSGTRH